MHTYNVVTTQAGCYVQGGGCLTVGVAGLIQSGGFGSFSKYYGLAAAGLRGDDGDAGSSSGTTTVAASASETPIRGQRSTVQETVPGRSGRRTPYKCHTELP